MAKVIVLIPTFDHGPTLLPAIHSALHQTESDLEVHIIGDGAPASTDALMSTLIETDSRVHYHPHPKSPRTGEPYRHSLLSRVDCDFVAYLSDDDIWAPNHVERLIEPLIRGVDFAATLTLLLGAESPQLMRVDLAQPSDRALLLGDVNRITLSAAGHRLDSYLRLPFGWRTTPVGQWTDHWMWKQWLGEPWVTAESIWALTAVHIPRQFRANDTNEDMAAKSWEWWGRVSHTGWERDREAMLISAGSNVERLAEIELANSKVKVEEADLQLAAIQDKLSAATERQAQSTELNDRLVRQLELAGGTTPPSTPTARPTAVFDNLAHDETS